MVLPQMANGAGGVGDQVRDQPTGQRVRFAGRLAVGETVIFLTALLHPY